MVLMGSDYPLVSGGLKFIHGFSGILTTLWYHSSIVRLFARIMFMLSEQPIPYCFSDLLA
jgi:hypothetical protein